MADGEKPRDDGPEMVNLRIPGTVPREDLELEGLTRIRGSVRFHLDEPDCAALVELLAGEGREIVYTRRRTWRERLLSWPWRPWHDWVRVARGTVDRIRGEGLTAWVTLRDLDMVGETYRRGGRDDA
ncbi:MAG: hypothetical protein ACLFWG_00055 [Longimicrobiales bacterium]